MEGAAVQASCGIVNSMIAVKTNCGTMIVEWASAQASFWIVKGERGSRSDQLCNQKDKMGNQSRVSIVKQQRHDWFHSSNVLGVIEAQTSDIAAVVVGIAAWKSCETVGGGKSSNPGQL